MHLYPLLGVEYKDSKYNNYFYGVSATDATRSGVAAYSAGAGTSPFGALMIETPLNPEWSLNTYLKRKWLSNSIANSPLVSERTVDNIFVSISRHFE
jgi:outer membrane protein